MARTVLTANRRAWCRWFRLVGLCSLMAAAGLTCPVAPPPGDMTIDTDTTLETLTVAEGTVTEIRNNARVIVTGDTLIAGTLRSTDGRVQLDARGSLVVNGRVSSTNDTADAGPADTPLADQPFAVLLVVGDQGATFGEGSSVQSIGPVVVTDDASVLTRTPQELFDEVEDVAADELPTLVPLSPDDDAFTAGPAVATLAPAGLAEPPLAPVTISGLWPAPGEPMPAGDAPVVVFRFDGPRPLILENFTLDSPPAPPGAAADQTADPGQDAVGGNGKNGMRLNIWNNGGPIHIRRSVTLNLADGGDGAEATSVCASARGGDGGTSGNFRMTASGGIQLDGSLVIQPGRSGHGGPATVEKGAPGADGCPGETGAPSTATGGKGADNRKRVFVRGNVAGLQNVTLGDVEAGDGGNATAAACDGGNGLPCCDGGAGGLATATAGDGGRATLDARALPGPAHGLALGGFGGNATATGGDGGDGGDCKFFDGGEGGPGGGAVAMAGSGGDATNPTGLPFAGHAGTATATGGDGGDGGDSGFGTPGGGGGGGPATATEGTPGQPDGDSGDAEAIEGNDGDPGDPMPVTVFCMDFAFVQADEASQIQPGSQVGPVFNEDGTTQVGSMEIEFVHVPDVQYARGDTPVPHIGVFGPGILDFKASTLTLIDGQPGVVGGIRIAVLFAEGINEQNPLIVQALDDDGGLIEEQQFTQVPASFDDPAAAEFIEARFNVEISVATFRIIAPQAAFVTPLRVYLLDP